MHASTNPGRWLVIAAVAGLHALLLAALAQMNPELKRERLPIEIALITTEPLPASKPDPLPLARSIEPPAPSIESPVRREPSPSQAAPPLAAMPQTRTPASRPAPQPHATAAATPEPNQDTAKLSPPAIASVMPLASGIPSDPRLAAPALPTIAQAHDASSPQEATPLGGLPATPMAANDSPPSKPLNAAAERTQANTGPSADASWSGNTPPAYPPAARKLREEGDVRLAVHIDESGRVGEVKVVRSSGSPRLDAAAIETVKKWRFRPATIDGQPVASWYDDWLWSFRFDP